MVIRFFLKVGLVCFILCFAQPCEAKVKLPMLISDGMVLQRDQQVSIWGFADPQEEVKINFRKKNYRTNADAAGNWKVTLPPMKAGGPYTMTINEIEIKDMLVGDVWLCSGQSNMELPISRVTDMFKKETETYSNPMIRHIKIPLAYNFHEPQADIRQASWKSLTPEDAKSFSAVAYFFAKEMYAKTNVPVGLINSAVGGSPVEAWISEEGLKPFPKYLNDRSLYQSDEYIADIRKLEQTRRNLWNVTLYKQDAGLRGDLKWFLPEYNDTSWSKTDLFDNSWSTNGLNPVNGSFWFRKDFEVSGNLAGKEAVLRMGCMVDADSVFVNGTFVGTVSYQYPPRIYKIPAGLLKEGKNNITVRLISYSGRPGFVKDKPYKIIFDNKEISLEGEWNYKAGAEMPPLQGETSFQYKPTGLYNAMIAPVRNYAVKGAIWYQGESNTGRHNEYYNLLTAMIAVWRKAWEQPKLPFVIIELASFGRPSDEPMQTQWAALRAAQRRVVENTPYTALAPAFDLGEWNDIHPLNKKDLGVRVARAMEQLTDK